MAFDKANFAPLGNPSKPVSLVSGVLKGAPTVWAYATLDTHATVIAAGYFNEVADLVNVGDVILATEDIDGTLSMAWLPVVSNAAGVVDVGDGLVIPQTDTT